MVTPIEPETLLRPAHRKLDGLREGGANVHAILDRVSLLSLRLPPGRSLQVRNPGLWPTNRDFAHAAMALWFAIATLTTAPGILAQPVDSHAPRVGQPGKDVIWVPTPEKAVTRMLTMARVGPGDFLIDLGSGDGRIVIMAAKHFGARGIGVDLNPDLVRLSEYRAHRAGVADRAKFYVRDIFKTELKQATVVTMYLLTELNLRLRPSLLRLAPGTRIVANAFDMGEWGADEFDTTSGSSLRLWIVPAPVAGVWAWSLLANGESQQLELEMNQQFQRLSGVVKMGQQRLRLREATLRGSQLSFVLLDQSRADRGVRYDYAGRVKGDSIEGEVVVSDDKRRLRWVAARQ